MNNWLQPNFILFYFFFQLPTQDELKTVLDKVKDFFGDAKESFGKLTSLNSATESSAEDAKEISKENPTWVLTANLYGLLVLLSF